MRILGYPTTANGRNGVISNGNGYLLSTLYSFILGGLATKESVGTTEDMDNLKTQGICTVNAISGYEQSNGMLVILAISSSIVYHYFVKYNGTVWSRIYWFNSWTAWKNL